MNLFGWVTAGLAALWIGFSRTASPKPSSPERILLIGDSLAQGLAAPLRLRAQQSQIPFDALAKQSTRIDQWAGSAELSAKLASFRPTLVMVSLGTNDEAIPAPSGAGTSGAAAFVEAQRKALRRLLFQVGPLGTDVLWIAPPKLPHASNGIRAMLEEELGPRLFHSERVAIHQGPDRIHPTGEGYREWADAIWRQQDSGQ